MLKRLRIVGLASLLIAGCAAQTQTSDAIGERAPAKPAAPEAKGVTLPPFETFVLDNGMQIILMEKHDVPLIAFDAIIRGGVVADPDGKGGTASLLAELLRKGAGERDAAEFARTVDGVGGILNTGVGKESVAVSGGFMARDAALMVELLADVLMNPLLSRDEFIKLRGRNIQQIRSMKDTALRALTSVYGEAFLFGDHPYGDVSFGSEASLANVNYADIRRYFIEHVGADRTILAVVGDFDTDTMRGRLENAFGDWRLAAGELPAIPAADERQGREVLLVDKPAASQTYFYLGNIGVARDYPNQAALDLVNTVFGGRFTSMLNTELRVESGLTYGAGSRLAQYTRPGSVAIMSFTRTETTGEAIDLSIAILERLHAQGLTAQQLESAKAYVLGQFPPELETNGEIAARLAGLRFYGLDRGTIDAYAEEVAAVTLADAQAAIESVYPSPEALRIVLIGNADAIREQAAHYGPVTEIRITDPRYVP